MVSTRSSCDRDARLTVSCRHIAKSVLGAAVPALIEMVLLAQGMAMPMGTAAVDQVVLGHLTLPPLRGRAACLTLRICVDRLTAMVLLRLGTGPRLAVRTTAFRARRWGAYTLDILAPKPLDRSDTSSTMTMRPRAMSEILLSKPFPSSSPSPHPEAAGEPGMLC